MLFAEEAYGEDPIPESVQRMAELSVAERAVRRRRDSVVSWLRTWQKCDVPLDVVVTLLVPPDDGGVGSDRRRLFRRAEAALRSALYYRTCPFRIHVVTLSMYVPLFRELVGSCVRGECLWYVSDLAEHAGEVEDRLHSGVAPPVEEGMVVAVDELPASRIGGKSWLHGEDARFREARADGGSRSGRLDAMQWSLYKLVLEQLLPSVDQAVVINHEVLVVRDICVASHETFYLMNEYQAAGRKLSSSFNMFMGLAPEMSTVYLEQETFAFKDVGGRSLAPRLFVGLNTNVMFMDLSRMRESANSWNTLWSSVIAKWRRETESIGDASSSSSSSSSLSGTATAKLYARGEQHVINLVAQRHPHSVLVLDCTYNIQLTTFLTADMFDAGARSKGLCSRLRSITVLQLDDGAWESPPTKQLQQLKDEVWSLFLGTRSQSTHGTEDEEGGGGGRRSREDVLSPTAPLLSESSDWLPHRPVLGAGQRLQSSEGEDIDGGRGEEAAGKAARMRQRKNVVEWMMHWLDCYSAQNVQHIERTLAALMNVDN